MANYKSAFSWRTAPRSIQVLINWLPYFNAFQGESWNQKVDQVFQLRRKLRWTYEVNNENPDQEVVSIPFDRFIQGEQINSKDKESLVRQVFTTAEQFGFLGVRGKDKSLYVTEAGLRIIDKTFTPEDFLVQLIKMFVITNKNEAGIFPFEIFIHLLKEFESLSRYELTYLFAVTTPSKYEQAVQAIEEFRKKYNDRQIIRNKKDNLKVEQLLKETWFKHFPNTNFLTSWQDYGDAFARAVTYTDIFDTTGRGAFTTIRVKDIHQTKFDLLVSGDYQFQGPPHEVSIKKNQTTAKAVASRNKLEWFGAVGNIALPWEDIKNRRKLTNKILDEALKKASDYDSDLLVEKDLIEFGKIIQSTKSNLQLKDIENVLSKKITETNIEYYERVESKTKENKNEILDRFNTILNDNDMSALWLEVNTWKSLVSLEGNQKVIPNFKMESDLTPRSFAPGIGNTPDMELYTDKYLIIPEVSLMTGKVQWEHEASSVIDHILAKSKENEDKETIGLFISQAINERTFWQFFILTRESWLGKALPVIPLTILQYAKLMHYFYERNESIDSLFQLLTKLKEHGEKVNNYHEWKEAIKTELEAYAIKFKQ